VSSSSNRAQSIILIACIKVPKSNLKARRTIIFSNYMQRNFYHFKKLDFTTKFVFDFLVLFLSSFIETIFKRVSLIVALFCQFQRTRRSSRRKKFSLACADLVKYITHCSMINKFLGFWRQMFSLRVRFCNQMSGYVTSYYNLFILFAYVHQTFNNRRFLMFKFATAAIRFQSFDESKKTQVQGFISLRGFPFFKNSITETKELSREKIKMKCSARRTH
jgi:hypothetical protein